MSEVWAILATYGIAPLDAVFILCILNLCGTIWVVTFRRYQIKVAGAARVKRVNKHKLTTKNRKRL